METTAAATPAAWRDWNRARWEARNALLYSGNWKRNLWPWYSKSLDPDIAWALREYGVRGGRILDLGTCSGSQAIALAKRRFAVVGTDVSESALEQARASLAQTPGHLDVEFVRDDILDTRLAPGQFDAVLDRGCFHSIYHFGKDRYTEQILKLLKPRGLVLLKTMSIEETRFASRCVAVDGVEISMPQRFDRGLLRASFAGSFAIREIRESRFYSVNVGDPARALLTIMSGP